MLISPPFRLAIKQRFRFIRQCRLDPVETGSDKSLRDKFSRIYEGNIFGGHKSRSGAGSDLDQTKVIRSELPALVKKFGVRSFLDAPCGDWYWMRHVVLGVEKYIGVDIVDALISRNQREFGGALTSFVCTDLAQNQLPVVDLIFSRDLLVHLSFEDALRVLRNFKISGAKYLLTTTFVDVDKNNELIGKDDFWRPLNMQLSPFNFPQPLTLINEGCSEDEGKYKDKCLGLWLLADVDV